MMELKEREQVVKDLQEIVDNYSGSWKRFNVLDNALALIKELTEENKHLQDLIKEVQEYNEAWVEDNGKLRKEMKTLKADTVRKMQSQLTDASEFALRADSNGGMYYVDCAAWVEEVAKELLEENK